MSDSPWLEHRMDVPVYYEDTDFTGFVYHANYLKYFERSRELMLGLSYVKELYQKGVHFVVHKVDLKYMAPARHGDTLQITSRLRLSESPVSMVEHKASKTQDGQTIDLVEAKIRLVAVDEQGSPIPVPEDVQQYLRGLYDRQSGVDPS